MNELLNKHNLITLEQAMAIWNCDDKETVTRQWGELVLNATDYIPIGISEGYLHSEDYAAELQMRQDVRAMMNMRKPNPSLPLDQQIAEKASYKELEAAFKQGVNKV